MTVRNRPHVPAPPTGLTDIASLVLWARKLFDAIKAWRIGKFDCTKEFTLTANAATSTLTDYRLSPQSYVGFDPRTANAATEKAAGTLYALTANRGDGAWTITHANNAQNDRTYTVVILG
jgi:hypothetical protein